MATPMGNLPAGKMVRIWSRRQTPVSRMAVLMTKKRRSIVKIHYQLGIGTLLLTVFLWGISGEPAFAQEEADNPETEPPCIPADLSTPYDLYTQSGVDENQLNIWYDYGREYYRKGTFSDRPQHYQSALPYFWKVVLNDTLRRFKVVYGKIVECYLKLNQPDSALIAAYRGLKEYPDYATLHYHAGQIQKGFGRTSCAIPHFEALVKDQNQPPTILKNYYGILAQLYWEVEDERAIAAQEKVVELAPNDVEASATLAKMVEFFGYDPLEARESAFLKDTTNVTNARQYGITAFESGYYQKAIRAFKAVLKVDPENIEALSYIGRSYEALDRLSDAISAYQVILKIDPNRLNTLAALASVYSRQHNFSTAKTYVQKALRIDPNYGLAYMVMGEIYENAANYCSSQREKKDYTYDDKLVFELAQKEYEKAAARDPNVAAMAQNRIRLLKAFVRTKADIHMHSNRETIRDDCYRWINPNL